MNFVSIGLFSFFFSYLWAFTAVGQQPVSKLFKVGALLPLTGQIAYFGNDAQKAIELAFENEKGTALYFQDSQSTPQGSVQGMNTLILNYKVEAIIGDLPTGNTLASSPIAEKAKIPLLTPSSTGDGVTQGRRYVFQVCYQDSVQGKALAQYAYQKQSVRNVALVIDGDSQYSTEIAQAFAGEFKKLGGSIVLKVQYSSKQNDFTTVISKLKKLNHPDLGLFIPGFPEQVGPLLKTIYERKVKAKIFGADGWDFPVLKDLAGAGYAGHYFTSHFSTLDKRPEVKEFVDKFYKKFHSLPSVFAALSYDSAKILIEAHHQVTPKENVWQKIKSTHDLSGVTGKLSFNKQNHIQKSVLILKTDLKENQVIEYLNP